MVAAGGRNGAWHAHHPPPTRPRHRDRVGMGTTLPGHNGWLDTDPAEDAVLLTPVQMGPRPSVPRGA